MAIQIPHCLDFLTDEPRWVGWRWEERNGRRMKPPIRVTGGHAGGYARNDSPQTWALLGDVMTAIAEGAVDGVGADCSCSE